MIWRKLKKMPNIRKIQNSVKPLMMPSQDAGPAGPRHARPAERAERAKLAKRHLMKFHANWRMVTRTEEHPESLLSLVTMKVQN